MWLLRNENKGLIFRISPGKENIVGRKDVDILLLGDQSISRKHAVLYVNNENGNKILLKDLGSKYGTFTVSGEEVTLVPPNQEVRLKNGDSVRFGIQWNTWRVEFLQLMVTTSTLSSGEKTEVKQVVAALGGQVVSDWQPECTHLTMNKITVTVKVVCALAYGKPIVKPGYWNKLKEALASTQTTLPKCEDFVPPLAEAVLNPTEVSFAPNLQRRTLFSGYTFVAVSARQLARIKPMVTASGGHAVEFSVNSWPESRLMDEKTILMQHTAAERQGSQQSQVPDGYFPVARKLKAAGVRCVPESEIGLSILYCSMNKFCNPRFSSHSLFASSEVTQPTSVICHNSQESTNSQESGGKSASTRSKKRALEQSGEDEYHPSKKTNDGGNSEDMFGSQVVDKSKTERNSNKSSSALKKPVLEKPLVVDPSLDMFAPSGHISSERNKIIGNNPELNNKQSTSIEKTPVVNPSLDMFAPSGQISTNQNKTEEHTSSQDLFASLESREAKKRDIANDSSITLNKKLRLARDNEKNDEFAFPSTKRSNRHHVVYEDEGDEFSFAVNKRDKSQVKPQAQDDEFSFASNKASKKRNRQSNPDIFGSTSKCLTSNDKFSGPHSKVKINCEITSNDNDIECDDLFAFTGGSTLKRRRVNENVLNTDEPDAEVRVALLSRRENFTIDVPNTSEPSLIVDPPDEKSLVIYSKDKLGPDKIKEMKDEEIDELAKELHNATVVVVKPLVAARAKPIEAEAANNGKNFKKFRKVVGMNKRMVPHIIGGSDLVPHYASCLNIDDILPSSPPHESPEDEWGFPKEKKKGKR